jgi:hypothetical protein
MKKHEKRIGSGEVGQFDQRNTMFSRPRDPEKSSAEVLDLGKKHYGVRHFKDDEGYTLLDWAFAMGSWYLERWWGYCSQGPYTVGEKVDCFRPGGDDPHCKKSGNIHGRIVGRDL